MTLCAVLQGGDNMMRGLIGCVVCLVCLGPILLIVGIVLVVAPNDRADRVSEFNQAVSNFNGDTGSGAELVKLWRGPVRTSTGFNVSIQNAVVDVTGNQEGVQSGDSVWAQAGVTAATITGSISYDLTVGPKFNVQGIDATAQRSHSIKCSRDACSSRCSDSSDRRCSTTALTSKCKQLYGPSAKFSGSACTGSRTCGTCDYLGYLATVCAVAQVSSSSSGNSSGYSRDTSKQSCFYPFATADNKYMSTPPSTVSVQLRLNTDPFIVLQEITDGSNDFGLTRAQQTSIGITCIVFGCILISCILVPLYLYNKKNSEQQESNAEQGNYSNGDNQVAAQPAQHGSNDPYNQQQQQPVYGQPQPQPGYGHQQQQPGYGQPQPGYGQPQQQYNQYPAQNQQQPYAQQQHPQQKEQPPNYSQQV